MSAIPPRRADQYVVSFGKSGALGVFTSELPLALRRHQSVLVQTHRGIEIGKVLGPASLVQARLLGATASGTLVRPFQSDDEAQRSECAAMSQSLFAASRACADRDQLGLEILDVDVMFDRRSAIVQFVGSDLATDRLAHALEQQFGLAIRLENVAVHGEHHEHGGCDKPDCGRQAGGGCTTCDTGGGCSTCGSGKTDLREYFGHLRTKMESRIPLT